MTKFKVLTDRLNTFFTNNKITTGNSIPTSGEWNVGDICISSIQENGECGWICTESGTPGKWEIFGSGGSGKLVSLSSSVEVTGPVTEVSLNGLGTNVSENDKLFVHYNSTHLLEGVDFEIISNGTKIRKLGGGSWNESSSNAMFAFELLKHVKKVNGDNILLDSKMCVLKSNKTISAPTSEVEIGIEGFNKDSDYLTVYVNSTYLTEGVDYNISSDSRKIVSLNGNWNEESLSEYRFSFVVIKEVGIVNPEAVVGTENLKEGSVTMGKLGEDVIERLNGVDTQLEHNMKNTLNLYSFGAIADNSTDNYISLNNLFKEAGKDIVYDLSISPNSFFTKTINIPPGIYRVKQPNLFKDCFSVRTQNLVINGNGATIVCEGFEGSLFENNDKVLGVDIYNLNFTSINDSSASNRKFISSESHGGAQSIRFHQCTFSGKWKYGIDLTGSNCNSEWVFNQCSFYGNWESFLYIGDTNTSDQFLNYWFNNCKYWCSSNWITAHKGGHFKLNHCDVSGYEPTEDTYLFKLLGNSHSSGVTTFIDDGTRYELKSSQAKVIHCEWEIARISFENSDFSSNSFNVVERSDVFSFVNNGTGIGSCYIFTNCTILGKFKLHTSNDAHSCDIILNNCSLNGGDNVSTIHDIFNITYSDNVGAVFRVYLNHVKYLDTIYNMILNSNVGQLNILNNNAILTQSPYNNLVSGWEHKISQTTIIDEVIYFTKGYLQDGHTYNFSVKSNTGCVVEQINVYDNKKNIKCSNISRLYIGNKITIGDSNTVYEIIDMDMASNYIVLDKEIEDVVAVGNEIEFNILDISQKPLGSMKLITSDKYIVRNKLYLKNTGDTPIPITGITSAIIVKTLE